MDAVMDDLGLSRVCHNGIHYVGLPSTDLIDRTPVALGDHEYSVGYVFQRIGSKERSSLDVGWPMKYCGKFGPFILFDRADRKTYRQMDFFNPDLIWFVAPAYMDRHSLMMQSGASTFWDIEV